MGHVAKHGGDLVHLEKINQTRQHRFGVVAEEETLYQQVLVSDRAGMAYIRKADTAQRKASTGRDDLGTPA